MNHKALQASDLGRRIVYRPPTRANAKKDTPKEYIGILVDFDTKSIWIMCEALGKEKFKVAPISVEFVR